MIPTVVAAVVLMSLGCLNLCIRRSLFYPPVLFCIWWSFLLLVVACSGDSFYPLSLKTLGVFVLGALSFTAGGSARILFHRPSFQLYVVTGTQQQIANRFLTLGIIALVAAFPFYWMRLQELRAASFFNDFWRGVRQQTSSGFSDQGGFGFYAYVMGVATFLSLIAVYNSDGSGKARLRSLVVIALTLAYHFLTAARMGAMTTLLGLMTVSRIRSGKVNWRLWAVGALCLIFVFTVPAILLHKGGDPSKSVIENFDGVLSSLQVYLVGGVVAFDQIVDDPSVVPSWLSFRFFLAAAHAIGFNVTVPNVVLPFTATPALTNVYTIYGSYFSDFGWLGVAVLLFLLGYLLTMLYQSASRQRPESVVLFGIAVSYLLMSAATDGFLISMSYWLQALLSTLVIYHWPFASRRQPRFGAGRRMAVTGAKGIVV
jgi:oligosaccharide repeat unit polymerase